MFLKSALPRSGDYAKGKWNKRARVVTRKYMLLDMFLTCRMIFQVPGNLSFHRVNNEAGFRPIRSFCGQNSSSYFGENLHWFLLIKMLMFRKGFWCSANGLETALFDHKLKRNIYENFVKHFELCLSFDSWVCLWRLI